MNISNYYSNFYKFALIWPKYFLQLCNYNIYSIRTIFKNSKYLINMNLFVLCIFFSLFLFSIFSHEDVFAELLVTLDNEIVSSMNDDVIISVKLDYSPKDNFIVVQLKDPDGFLFFNRFIPVDDLNSFKINFAGNDNFSLSGGIYEIKLTGIVDDDTIIDTNSFVLFIKEESIISSDSTDIENNGGCLIATATFGSELSPQVQNLREIRDNVVLKTSSGMSFMMGFNQFYYSFSPYIADYERENLVFKEAVKIGITPLLYSLSFLNFDNEISEIELIFYGIGIIVLNIIIYFIIPYISFLKLKNFIIPRIHSKNKHIS